jgi:hypothetical protein
MEVGCTMTEEAQTNEKLSRRQFIKTASIAALGLIYTKPQIETLSTESVLAHYGGTSGGGTPGGGNNPGGGGEPGRTPSGDPTPVDWLDWLWDWLRGRRRP